MISRRSLLAAIPAIGTGLTGGQHVAVVHVTATARERFDHHFAELAAVMDELTADADGWRLHAGADGAAGRRVAFHHRQRVYIVQEPIRSDGRPVAIRSVGGGTEMRTHLFVERQADI